MGSEDGMAKVIEFYVPSRFKRIVKWIPAKDKGQLLNIGEATKKSA
jgi:hypothetical protein